MVTFRFEGTELAVLRGIAETLRDANKRKNEAEKAAEAAKKKLGEHLKERRQFEIETMTIGDIVHVEDVIMIEVSSQNKFDAKAFMLAEPESYEKYKRDFPMLKFKPMV